MFREPGRSTHFRAERSKAPKIASNSAWPRRGYGRQGFQAASARVAGTYTYEPCGDADPMPDFENILKD